MAPCIFLKDGVVFVYITYTVRVRSLFDPMLVIIFNYDLEYAMYECTLRQRKRSLSNPSNMHILRKPSCLSPANPLYEFIPNLFIYSRNKKATLTHLATRQCASCSCVRSQCALPISISFQPIHTYSLSRLL